MGSAKLQRNANIELLRVLMGMAVVVLHFNFLPEGGGAASMATGANRYMLLFLESICIVAVNVFLIISGYFSANKKSVNLIKPIQLLIQLIVFNLILYLIQVIPAVGKKELNARGLIGAVVPANYYVIMYIAVLLLSPFLNVVINRLSKKGLFILGGWMFALFSVYPTLVDLLEDLMNVEMNGLNTVFITGSGAGYTIVNFVMCYLLGAILSKLDLDKFRGSILFTVWIGCLIVLMIWRAVLPDTAWMYCNPIVIIESLVLFMMFAKSKIKGRWICTIAPASFSCYLIHGTLLHFINPESMADAPIWMLLGYLVLVIIVIYAISVAVYFIWNFATGKLFAKLGEQFAKTNLVIDLGDKSE